MVQLSHKQRTALAGAVCAVFWVVEAGAAAPEELTRERGWPFGTIQEQLDLDPTAVGFGKGAIFVPAMTNPLDEPPVGIWQGNEKVAEGTTGERIIVLPGTYTVRMGSGAIQERLTVQATVRELHTTVIPVSWAGLVVHVADERLSTLRGSYELIRVDDREYIGIGFGADEQAGEPVTTWIIRPGLYKIVRVGETYRARRDFSTVRLEPGRLTHFMLVIDPDTERFQGGGEVPEEELFIAQPGELWTSFILGGDMSFNSRNEHVPALEEGESYAIRAFADTKLSGDIGGNPVILQLQIEEGQTKLPGQDWQKTQDRADLDGLYVYELYSWLGPYVRFGAETNLLEGRERFTTDAQVNTIRRRLSGRETVTTDVASFRVTGPFGLISVKEGAGLNVRLFKSLFGESTVRVGVGARHRITRHLFEETSRTVEERPDPERDIVSLTYDELDDTHQVGIETTLLAVARLTRWVLFNIEVDSLVPFDKLDEVVLEVDGTVALKLTSFASLNYVLRYQRDRSIFPEGDPMEHDVLLRFSIELP